MSNRVSRRFFRGVLSGNDMTLKWFPWVCAGATGSWGGFPFFFLVFLDMLCTFDSLSHPIDGHSAFIQAFFFLFLLFFS
jgi:hypothetical protein